MVHRSLPDPVRRQLVLEDLYQLDSQALAQQGVLRPNQQGTLHWPQDHGDPLLVDLQVEADVLLLRPYLAKEAGAVLSQRILLSRTRQHLGGERTWLICPSCQQRCRILYWTTSFVCRRCTGLHYASQRQHPDERMLIRAKTIRARLGGSGSMAAPFPNRPKGMRHTTYERLRAEEQFLNHTSLMTVAKRLRLPRL